MLAALTSSRPDRPLRAGAAAGSPHPDPPPRSRRSRHWSRAPVEPRSPLVPTAAGRPGWTRLAEDRPEPPTRPDRGGRFMARAADEAVEFGEWAETSSVGPITLEQLHQDVRAIARDYLTQPPYPLLRRALHHRRRVFALLEGRVRPAQARDLYLLAGRLCGLAGWMVGDLGYAAEAGTHARTAWLCADLADHRRPARLGRGRPRASWPTGTAGRHVRASWPRTGCGTASGTAAGCCWPGWPRAAGPGLGDADRARGALDVVTAERGRWPAATRSAASGASARRSSTTWPAPPTCGCGTRSGRPGPPTGRSGCTRSPTRRSASTAPSRWRCSTRPSRTCSPAT